MLSLKEFRAKLTSEISADDLGKFNGGYDVTKHTSPTQNPHQPPGGNFSDVMYYDYCYDSGVQYQDYMGGNYAL